MRNITFNEPYMVYSHGKILKFTRNNESKGSFSPKNKNKKNPQVNFLLIRAFSGLDP